MSGGGGSWKSIDPRDLAKKTREAEAEAANEEYESEVNQFLSSQLAQYNDRDSDKINRILNAIIEKLGKEISGALDLLFGGSIAKRTYVDGLSDVDALLLFDKTELAEKTPKDLKKFVEQVLRDHFGDGNVRTGELAITVTSGGFELQLLPALRKGDSFRIAASDSAWATIKPESFAKELTSVNALQNGKAVPTIKLAKALLSQLPAQQQLTGYHVESIAVQVFREYKGPTTLKSMLSYFMDKASDAIRTPIPDKTGQSEEVDAYLGSSYDVRRRATALAVERIARKMRNADGMLEPMQWKSIFGEEQ